MNVLLSGRANELLSRHCNIGCPAPRTTHIGAGFKTKLQCFVMDPARRRLGLGATLLREALDAAAREGMSAVSLEVRLGNEPALKMYQTFGFEQTGRRQGYYADTGEDALILTLELG